MKKIIVYAMAIASIAAVSCNKIETQAPLANEGQYSITATIDNSDTKTAYDADGKFSWVAGDKISVVVYNAESPYTTDKYSFAAEADGNTATFKSVGTPDWTAYPKSGFAIYPNSLTLGGEKDSYTVSLPDNYTLSSGSDFTKIGIPMIGTEESENVFRFKTAVGILKVTLTNVPVSARKLVITTSGDNVSGTFPLNATTAENGLAMADATSAGNSITVNFPQQAAGATVSILVPVPAGKISAGATFAVQQSDGTAIKTTPATVRDITIERNHVLPLPAIAVEDWVSLGTGKFMDDDVFYATGWYGRTAADYVDVEIQQHATDKSKFRIVNPYKAYMDQKGKSAMSGAVGPNEYLTFTLKDGYVENDYYRTGLDYYGLGYEVAHDNPVWYGYNRWNNCIIKEDTDGNWTNIQLAPLYFNNSTWAVVANTCENPKIEIVREGYEPIRLGYANYPTGAAASVNGGNSITATWTNGYVTGMKVTLASDLATGVEKLKNNTDVLTFSTSGESQPAGVSSGSYRLVSQVMTDGHGWTYKDHGTVFISAYPQISLSESMLSPSATEPSEGSVAGLIDGSMTAAGSYWHSPWSIPGTYDATYGVYIDIDLGEGKGVKDFQLYLCSRANAYNDQPDHIKVYATNDKSDWGTALAEQSSLYATYVKGKEGDSNWYNPFEGHAADAQRYIRISILSTDGNNGNKSDLTSTGCTHLGEIILYGE